MPVTRRTNPSTRKLSEVARHVVYPSGIVTTGWPAVAAQCAKMGVTFDGWQDGLGKLTLGKRADGKYAAAIGGVFLSIPRQVGKTFFVGMVVLALCILNPGMTVLWTAHRKPTAMMTLDKLKTMCGKRKIRPHVLKVKTGNDEGSIEFRNGSKILFGARERGFGRGYDEVDVEIFDECQILTEKALEDMIAATNQSRQPAGALVFYMGTPPRPTDPGEVFRARRAEALSGEAEDMIYVEMSADEDVDPAAWSRGGVDWEQVAKANPSYPDHTPREAIQRMVKMLPSPASIRREGLGVWDADTTSRTIPAKLWDSLVGEAPESGAFGYGVRFRDDAAELAICLAPEDGPAHVESIEQRPMSDGVDWLADWIAARVENDPLVVMDGREGQELLLTALRKRGVPRRMALVPDVPQVIDAHAEMLAAINARELTHANQAALNGAVAVAGKRRIGSRGGWGWQAIDDGDILPLDAATLAHYGATQRREKQASKGRQVIVYG